MHDKYSSTLRLVKSWRNDRKSQIRFRHTNYNEIADTLSPSRFPNLEQRRDEIARMSIAGNMNMSQSISKKYITKCRGIYKLVASTSVLCKVLDIIKELTAPKHLCRNIMQSTYVAYLDRPL